MCCSRDSLLEFYCSEEDATQEDITVVRLTSFEKVTEVDESSVIPFQRLSVLCVDDCTCVAGCVGGFEVAVLHVLEHPAGGNHHIPNEGMRLCEAGDQLQPKGAIDNAGEDRGSTMEEIVEGPSFVVVMLRRKQVDLR
jgi:hypothetical protein